ncbi:hypothetical protein [Paucibacter soli]|uniref:hypothetical protein n=1 Tax=Paucibacter soli TaxID=3133433 RepID=UPI0030A9CB07
MSVLINSRPGRLAALGVAALWATCLAACGGGGSSDSSGSNPTDNLYAASSEAQKAVEGSLSAANAAVSKSVVLGQNPLFDLGSPSATAAAKAAARPRAHAVLSKPQAVEAFTCVELELFTGPCTGSATVEANFAAGAAKIPAGSFIAMSFTNLAGPVDTLAISMSGQYRIDFLSEVDSKASSYANAHLKLSTTAFAGKLGDYSFGPDSSVALVDYDASGAPTLTIGELVLSKVQLEGPLSNTQYRLANAQVRQPYWASGSSNKIDYLLQPWELKAARPAPGSTATLAASNAASAKVEVTASAAASVVYAVQISAAGTTKRYTVTASYASGSDTPSYGVAELN